MSTLTGRQSDALLRSEKDLEHYFERFAKPKAQRKVGLEAEFFAVHRETGQAISYEGPGGIEDILCRLAKQFSYEPVTDGGRVIGLSGRENFVSLEPGGQVELSAPPVGNVFEIQRQIEHFIKELKEVTAGLPHLAWISVGIQPFSGLDETPWVPKKRYAIMGDYFKTHGSRSHEMMKLTATNQINLDYLDEQDAMSCLRTVYGITAIATALFSNSSFSEGKPNGFLSRRLYIWQGTDPERTGYLVQFTKPGRTFRDYLDYILDMPMIFVVRDRKWIPVQGLSFRTYLREGRQGLQATLSDFELHLSVAFPEARFKQYLEVRGIDAQPVPLIPAVAAFWKGILYDERTRDEAWKIVAFASDADRLRLHEEVPKKGLKAKLGGRPIFPLARELVDLSCGSLARQGKKDEFDECDFLNRIRELILKRHRSPAGTLLEKWREEFKGEPRKLIDHLAV